MSILKRINAAPTLPWALVVLAVALAFSSYVWSRPVDKLADGVGAPIARSLGVDVGRCPNGWVDTSSRATDTRVLSCERDGWLVILKPDGGFERGLKLNLDGAQWTEDAGKVEGWPR